MGKYRFTAQCTTVGKQVAIPTTSKRRQKTNRENLFLSAFWFTRGLKRKNSRGLTYRKLFMIRDSLSAHYFLDLFFEFIFSTHFFTRFLAQ